MPFPNFLIITKRIQLKAKHKCKNIHFGHASHITSAFPPLGKTNMEAYHSMSCLHRSSFTPFRAWCSSSRHLFSASMDRRYLDNVTASTTLSLSRHYLNTQYIRFITPPLLRSPEISWKFHIDTHKRHDFWYIIDREGCFWVYHFLLAVIKIFLSFTIISFDIGYQVFSYILDILLGTILLASFTSQGATPPGILLHSTTVRPTLGHSAFHTFRSSFPFAEYIEHFTFARRSLPQVRSQPGLLTHFCLMMTEAASPVYDEMPITIWYYCSGPYLLILFFLSREQ